MSIAPDDGDIVLREGNSFQVGIERAFTLGEHPGTITFQLDEVSFDESDTGRIRDALEVDLVDATGKSVVPTFTNPNTTAFYPSRIAYFNQTEGVGVATGSGVTVDADGKVTLDVSGLAPGQLVTVRFQLINNDGDTGSFVRLHVCDPSPVVHVDLANDTAPRHPVGGFIPIDSPFAGPG
ncbi:MAG: hypothetical protein LC104_05985, partial [Bacteroidales bacterium]|nr:hypothetical protein [Bacteroidales bacterium]